MVKKGWVIGIALTLISVAWIPIVMIPVMFMDGFDKQKMMQPITEHVKQMKTESIPEHFERMITEPVQQQVPAPGFEDVPEMIVESSKNCSGSAGCFTDYVTRIVDGDTIHTATLKIRLSLTNTPETYQEGFNEATEFTEKLCPVGSEILVDQDDLQKVDQYGRVLAKVFCGDKVLNSELLYNGHANILTQYCSTSEFSGEAWAKRYGCAYEEPPKTTTPSTQTQQPSCDPSYPDFCIPPPPPDLDCKDIPQKRFTVLSPDPHRFDGDKDGIGCES
jgi:micrococcal nuclease